MERRVSLPVLLLLLAVALALVLAILVADFKQCGKVQIKVDPTSTPRTIATCTTNAESTTQCVFSDTIKIVVPLQKTPQSLVFRNLEVIPTLAATPVPNSTLIRTVINLDVTTSSGTPVREFNPALIVTMENLQTEYTVMQERQSDVQKGKRVRMYVFDNLTNTWRALTTLSSIIANGTLSMTVGIDHLPGDDADCDTRFD